MAILNTLVIISTEKWLYILLLYINFTRCLTTVNLIKNITFPVFCRAIHYKGRFQVESRNMFCCEILFEVKGEMKVCANKVLKFQEYNRKISELSPSYGNSEKLGAILYLFQSILIASILFLCKQSTRSVEQQRGAPSKWMCHRKYVTSHTRHPRPDPYGFTCSVFEVNELIYATVQILSKVFSGHFTLN